MTDIGSLLDATATVLLVDWPSRDVPDTLAQRGYVVMSADGPGRYNSYSLEGDAVVVAPLESQPKQADLVYVHRPVDELPEIVEMAKAVRAKVVWLQSGRDPAGSKDVRGSWLSPEESRRAREIVERAGLVYVEAPYIADAVRRASGRTSKRRDQR